MTCPFYVETDTALSSLELKVSEYRSRLAGLGAAHDALGQRASAQARVMSILLLLWVKLLCSVVWRDVQGFGVQAMGRSFVVGVCSARVPLCICNCDISTHCRRM